MIYDIEDGIFDREGIEAVCANRGFRMLKFHFTEGNDGRENKFFAWIEAVAGADLHSFLDLECDLGDNEEKDDEYSLSVDIRNDVVEITVYD